MKIREKSAGKSSSHKPQTSDVVIIGAGIIGLAVAYSLSRIGKSVQIIERSKPGVGQSTKTGGGIRLAHGSELNIHFSQLSLDTWLNFEKHFNIDPFYRTTGHLFLTVESESALFSQAALLERMKVDCELLTKSQISSYWPELSSTNFSKGLYCNEGGEWLGGLVLIAGLAALMSTMDSQLLATGSLVTRDLLQINENKGIGYREIVIICLAILGLLLSLWSNLSILDLGLLAFTMYAVIFPSVALVSFMDQVKGSSIIISILAGEAVVLLAVFTPEIFDG